MAVGPASSAPHEELYVVPIRTSTGLQRRLFFSGPPGATGSDAVRELTIVARRLAATTSTIEACCAALIAVGAEHGMTRVAH